MLFREKFSSNMYQTVRNLDLRTALGSNQYVVKKYAVQIESFSSTTDKFNTIFSFSLKLENKFQTHIPIIIVRIYIFFFLNQRSTLIKKKLEEILQ